MGEGVLHSNRLSPPWKEKIQPALISCPVKTFHSRVKGVGGLGKRQGDQVGRAGLGGKWRSKFKTRSKAVKWKISSSMPTEGAGWQCEGPVSVRVVHTLCTFGLNSMSNLVQIPAKRILAILVVHSSHIVLLFRFHVLCSYYYLPRTVPGAATKMYISILGVATKIYISREQSLQWSCEYILRRHVVTGQDGAQHRSS